MISFHTWLVFVPAALALILAPGPDTIYVLTRAIEQGRRIGISSAMGISTGVLVHTFAAVLGLSIILRKSALAFKVVKYVGAFYLVYLGLSTLRASQQFDLDATEREIARESQTGFGRGVLVNVLNPKVALFFLAFLPQFVSPSGSIPIQLLLLGGTYALLTLCYLAGIAVFAGTIRHVLITYSSIERVLRGLTGTVLVGLGIQLAFDEKLSA